MKILLVDDEIEFVSALTERLSLRGIEAEGVSRPEDAVARMEEGCHDLAVLDMKMPRMDGIALKKRLLDKCPEMKFIFLTGHGGEEGFKAGECEEGVYCCLLKPVKIENLIAKINEALASGKKGNENG